MSTPATRAGRTGGFEWAVAEAPLAGAAVSGDAAIVVDVEGSHLLAVVDGLGHGEAAFVAASAAVKAIQANLSEPLDSLLVLCHEALQSTRGAAMTLVRIDVSTASLQWVGVGNVDAHIVRGGPSGVNSVSTPVLSGGIVGFNLPKVTVRTVDLHHGDLIALATDGVDPRFIHGLRLAMDVTSLAGHVIKSNAKGTDDALVLVSRYWGDDDRS